MTEQVNRKHCSAHAHVRACPKDETAPNFTIKTKDYLFTMEQLIIGTSAGAVINWTRQHGQPK